MMLLCISVSLYFELHCQLGCLFQPLIHSEFSEIFEGPKYG